MTAMPAAAIAVIAAAYDDYRITTPADRQTPRGAAERAAEYLISEGWGLYVPTQTKRRVPCPACHIRHLVTRENRIRRHGPHTNPCPGGGTPVRQSARTAA